MSGVQLKGVAASPGIAIGNMVIMGSTPLVPRRESNKGFEFELNEFKQAKAKAEERMQELNAQLPVFFSSEMEQILASYKAIITDTIINESIEKTIRTENCSAGFAIHEAFNKVRAVLTKVSNPHVAEKVHDLDTVRDMILEQLIASEELPALEYKGAIVCAQVFSPRDLFLLSKVGAAAIVAEVGTRSSHVAILARNLSIPAVLGVDNLIKQARKGDSIAVDGTRGRIEINPSGDAVEQYKAQIELWNSLGKNLLEKAPLATKTLDNTVIEVHANLESSEEIGLLKATHAKGIGLFRLEFFYMQNRSVPTEEELVDELTTVSQLMKGQDVVIRLLDAGGDKEIPSLGVFLKRDRGQGVSDNPAMGLRGVRILLKRSDLLNAQCRAIVRANVNNNLQMLIPFVSDISEVRAVRAALRQAWRELYESGAAQNPIPKLGMMVELPAAVAMAGLFATEVEFFSIGTNDLTQHTLAVDRTDAAVSSLYDAFHPAVLNSVERTILEAETQELSVSLCGEMASDPLATELLVGMGLRKFSCSLYAIPIVKEILRNIHVQEAESLAVEILQMKSAEDIRKSLEHRFAEKFGQDLFQLVVG